MQLSPAPLALTEVAGAAHDGEIWFAGGLDAEGQGRTSVQRYDPSADAWRTGPDLPEAIHHSALVSSGEDLLLLGGYVGSDFANPTDAVWRLTTDAAGAPDGWEPTVPLPGARAAGAAAFDGTTVVYGGGIGPAGPATDVWAGRDDGWRRIGVISTPREHLAAASPAPGQVVFMAGRIGGLDGNLARADLATTTGEGRVVSLGDVLDPAGGIGGFAVGDGRVCIVGGETPDRTVARVSCTDASGRSSSLPPLAEARHGLGVAVLDGIVYAGLGGPEPGLFVSATLEALDLPR